MVVEATTLKLKCVRWCAVVAGAIYRYALSLGDFTSGGELCVEGSGAAAADEQDLAQTVGVPSLYLYSGVHQCLLISLGFRLYDTVRAAAWLNDRSTALCYCSLVGWLVVPFCFSRETVPRKSGGLLVA